MKDPIVEEVRRARSEHAQQFGFDLEAICEDLRRIQKMCSHKVVRLSPRRLKPASLIQRTQ